MPQRLKILTWNLGCADRAIRHASTSQEADLDGVAATITAEAPDFVTLQEVNCDAGHHQALAGRLDGYRVAAAGAGDRSRAVLARRPIRPVPTPDGLVPPPGSGTVASAFALAETDTPCLVVGSVHSPARARNTAARANGHRSLAAWMRGSRGLTPILVAGDFNVDPEVSGLAGRMRRVTDRRIGPLNLMRLNPVTSDYEADVAAIRDLLGATEDLARDAGPTCGLPRRWAKHLPGPLAVLRPIVPALRLDRDRVRIDLVLGSPGMRLLAARVIRRTGPHAPRFDPAPDAFGWMDHDPVVAEVEIVSPAQ